MPAVRRRGRCTIAARIARGAQRED
jgi:hypothetical protein